MRTARRPAEEDERRLDALRAEGLLAQRPPGVELVGELRTLAVKNGIWGNKTGDSGVGHSLQLVGATTPRQVASWYFDTARRDGWRITRVSCSPNVASVSGIKEHDGWDAVFRLVASATQRPATATLKLSAPFHEKEQRSSAASVEDFEQACGEE